MDNNKEIEECNPLRQKKDNRLVILAYIISVVPN